MHNRLKPSFGRRKARKMRQKSQKAYEELLPLLKLDSTQTFFNNSPTETWLEIGFGGGEHMLEQLARNPDTAIVGCEPFMNGVAKMLAHLSPQDYSRVRIWHEDVRYLLEFSPPSYFSKVFILFPDPWPKKRHQQRRLITTDFITKLLPTLKRGAFLHVASDDSSYVEQIQTVFFSHPSFTLCEGPSSANPLTWGNRPEGWPKTRYEQKALFQGKRCAYMTFQTQEDFS